MKQIIKLTESNLHRIIKESVKKILREWEEDPYSLDADEIYGDRAEREYRQSVRDKMFQDDWEMRNRRLRQKYPGKSEEWYEAMIDTFYENKKSRKAIKEEHGLPDSVTAIIYSDIIEDYQAQEIAEEYGISEEEGAAEWFKGAADEMDFAEDEMPLHREFVMNIPELNSKLYHDYGAGYYFLVKNADPSSAPMAMENTIRCAVKESLNRLIETDCAGVMQTGCGDAPKGTNPEAGQYTTAYEADDETKDRHPGFSVDGKAKWNKNENFSIMRRPMYNPKSGKKK